jgi:AcrR family transcriptional regulator
MDNPGLRERKKRQTRQALSWAALRLAVERGLDNVLVEDIAAEAGVSTRTFNNYFSSKAEAISSRHLDRMRTVSDALRARPADEPLWTALTHAALAPFEDSHPTPDADWQAGVKLMMSEPALIGEFLRVSALADRELAAAIAERTGTDPKLDLYPRLVAAAVGAATNVANELWLNADPPVSLTGLLRDALEQVAAGLPPPHST